MIVIFILDFRTLCPVLQCPIVVNPRFTLNETIELTEPGVSTSQAMNYRARVFKDILRIA